MRSSCAVILPLFLVIFAVAGACAHEPPAEGWLVTKDVRTGAPKIPVNEKNAVLAVLKEFLPLALINRRSAPSRTAFVLREESIPITKKKSLTFPQTAKEARHALPTAELDQALFEAFVKANRSGVLYQDRPGEARAPGDGPEVNPTFDFQPGGRIEVALKGEGGFDDFFKRFPKARGVVTMSRPGFDTKRQKFLIYVTVATGELASEGFLIVAKLGDDGWHIAKKAVLWSAE